MKKFSIFLTAAVLCVASPVPQTIMGGLNTNFPIDAGGLVSPSLPPEDSEGRATIGWEVGYRKPKDAFNVTIIEDTKNIQTKMSMEAAMNFYRDQFGKQG